MKIKILSCIPAFVCLLAASATPALAQSTVFTYQGRLIFGANPANGTYDLTFSLFNASSGPGQVGSTYPTPNTAVSNGLFTVALDFGANFPGANRWLEIAARTNGSITFTTLAPRQPLTATPYAIQAANAGLAASVSPGAVTGAGIQDATLTATKVASGQVVKSLNGLFDAVTLSAGANVTLTTNGSSLQLSSSGGATSGWALGGNGGTTSASFLGSTDNQPLELRVNGSRALRLEPNASGAPNVVGGSSVNFAAAGVKGAVIGGGGATNYSGVPYTNSVAADFSTVSGGFANSIQTNAGTSTIGGGFLNTIQAGASTSTIGGGYVNTIQTNANNSTIGGGSGNVIQQSATSATVAGGANNVINVGATSTTIGGGLNNVIQANATYATVAGGYLNAIQTGASSATVGGGYVNTIQTNAQNSTIGGGSGNVVQQTAASSTIAGGANNVIQPNAVLSTIGGGLNNSNLANAAYATIPGGAFNVVGGTYGFAAGHRAKALHPGAFVWADSLDADFPSVANDEFAIRAAGGVRISDTSPGLFFGTTTRQMLNLFQTGYGIGVQDFTVYQRSGEGFAWYRGGVHTNSMNDSGGGATLMTLDGSGDLAIPGNFSANFITSREGVSASVAVGFGVTGISTGNIGVYGRTANHGPQYAGVFGENSAVGGTAVIGNALTNNSAGVAGIADAAGSTGVYGRGTLWLVFYSPDAA